MTTSIMARANSNLLSLGLALSDGDQWPLTPCFRQSCFLLVCCSSGNGVFVAPGNASSPVSSMKGLCMGRLLILLFLLITLTGGCERDPPESAATQQFVQLQADQNRRIADLQLQMQSQLAQLNQERDRLETERRTIAVSRARDQFLAEAIGLLGMALSTAAPLLLGWAILRFGAAVPDSESITEALLLDAVSQQPALLMPLPRTPGPLAIRDSVPVHTIIPRQES
jgi:hypothetical protein